MYETLRYWWPDRGQSSDNARELHVERSFGSVYIYHAARELFESDFPYSSHQHEESVTIRDGNGKDHTFTCKTEVSIKFTVHREGR